MATSFPLAIVNDLWRRKHPLRKNHPIMFSIMPLIPSFISSLSRTGVIQSTIKWRESKAVEDRELDTPEEC